MYIDNSKALALLIISRCDNKPRVKAVGKEKSADSTDPRHDFAGEVIEIGGRTEAMESNSNGKMN